MLPWTCVVHNHHFIKNTMTRQERYTLIHRCYVVIPMARGSHAVEYKQGRHCSNTETCIIVRDSSWHESIKNLDATRFALLRSQSANPDARRASWCVKGATTAWAFAFCNLAGSRVSSPYVHVHVHFLEDGSTTCPNSQNISNAGTQERSLLYRASRTWTAKTAGQ